MSEPKKVYKDAEGVKIRCKTGKDLSAATLVRLYIKKPVSGTEITIDDQLPNVDVIVETPHSADGYVYYISVTGDLDEEGDYRVQSYLEIASYKGKGGTDRFHIYDAYE